MFLITTIVGRSTVMTTVLTISIIAIWSKNFRKTTVYMGLLAGILLLSGDITSGIGPSNIISFIIGLGYLLLMLWYILIGWQFFQLAKVERIEEKID